jgi:hypothetical protein
LQIIVTNLEEREGERERTEFWSFGPDEGGDRKTIIFIALSARQD